MNAKALLLAASIVGCGPRSADAIAPSDTTAPPDAPRGTTCPEGTRVMGAAPPAGAAQWCERPDGTKHGPSHEWTSDGRLVAEGAYLDGERDGPWRTYHGSGLPRTFGRYAAGEMVGTWHEWDADGAPIARFVYAEGGHDVEETQWWPGPLKSRGTTRDGELHGRVLELDAQGHAVRDAEYDGGKLVRDNLAAQVPATIGVPECDAYIASYRRCIEEKLPEAVRETSRKALDTSVEAWRRAAETPAGREGLAQACHAASEAIAASCGL